MGLPDDDTGGAAAAASAPASAGATGAAAGGAAAAAGATGGAGAGRGAGAGAGGAGGAARGGAGGAGGGVGASAGRAGGRGGAVEPLEVSTRRTGGVATGGDAGAAGASETGASGTGAGAAGAAGASASGVALAAAFLAVAFLGFSGSGGCSSRMRPSRSALRRTRSACGSSMLEECVLTAMPRFTHRSRVSLLVRPSSFASSWTRIFAANVCSPGLPAFVAYEATGTPRAQFLSLAQPGPRARSQLAGTSAGQRPSPSAAQQWWRCSPATERSGRSHPVEPQGQDTAAFRGRATLLARAVYGR